MLMVLGSAGVLCADELDELVDSALARAAGNESQLRKALDQAPPRHKKGMKFLIAYMPELTALFAGS